MAIVGWHVPLFCFVRHQKRFDCHGHKNHINKNSDFMREWQLYSLAFTTFLDFHSDAIQNDFDICTKWAKNRKKYARIYPAHSLVKQWCAFWVSVRFLTTCHLVVSESGKVKKKIMRTNKNETVHWSKLMGPIILRLPTNGKQGISLKYNLRSKFVRFISWCTKWMY